MKKSNLSDQPVFWIGQVPPQQDINKRDLNRWGNRVKVRIMGIHSPNGNVTPDSGLAYAQVVHSTAHGSLNMVSTGIIGGEIVFGMYLNKDGTTLKNPFILGVLALLPLSRFSCLTKCFGSWRTFAARLSHFLTAPRSNAATFCLNVCI